MKKSFYYLSLMFLAAFSLIVLVACGDDSCKHDAPESCNISVEENRIEATCTKDGSYDAVIYCSLCHDELSRTEKVIPKGHTPKDAIEEYRVEATCTEDGHYDSVVYCDVCDGEISRETVTLPATSHNPTSELKCSKCSEPVTYYRDGDYIYFGEYPQTLKADSITITSTVDSRGYYLGSDGSYYAKVVAATYDGAYSEGPEPYKFSTGATVNDGETYYFKVEPIRWKVLSEKNNSALILCDSIIENRRYDSSYNNYAESEISEWLNETFYETAFTELQREMMLTTRLYNSAPWDVVFDGVTDDKIFLMSFQNMRNDTYGFAKSYTYNDVERRRETSDYTRARGACMSTESKYYGNGIWWLRTPGDASIDMAMSVLFGGSMQLPKNVNYSDYVGVVPAIGITFEE